MIKKVVLFTSSIEEVSDNNRVLEINGEQIRIDSVCKTLAEYNKVMADENVEWVFTYVSGNVPSFFVGETGIVHGMTEEESNKLETISQLSDWIERWNTYWREKVNEEPETAFEAVMKSIYINNLTQKLADEVDEDLLLETIKESREERANIIRTEWDLLNRIIEQNEIGDMNSIVVFDKDNVPKELKLEEITEFINTLKRIVVDGSSSRIAGEKDFGETEALTYKVVCKLAAVYRSNCEFEIEEAAKEYVNTLEDLK